MFRMEWAFEGADMCMGRLVWCWILPVLLLCLLVLLLSLMSVLLLLLLLLLLVR